MQTSIFSRLMVLLILLFTTYLVWADSDKEAEWEKRAQSVLQLLDDGYYEKGIKEAELLLKYSKDSFGLNHDNTSGAYNIIGLLNSKLGNYFLAESAYEEALRIAAKTQNINNKMTFQYNLAIIYKHQERKDEAEKLALSIYHYRKENRDTDVESFINIANVLAIFYNEQGNTSKVTRYYKEAIDNINSSKVSRAKYDYVFYNLGLHYKRLGNFKKSNQSLNESLTLAKQAHGDQHIEVAKVYYALADNYIETNQHTLAKPLYENALAIREQVFGTQHELVADCILGLADVHRATGSAKQAHSYYRKAVRIYKRSLGNSSAPMAVALNSWGVLYSQENNFEQAVALQTQALAMHQQHSDDQDYTSIIALNLGKAQTETQDFEQAEINLNKALTLRQQLKQSNRQIKPVNDALVALYQASGQQAKAKARQ